MGKPLNPRRMALIDSKSQLTIREISVKCDVPKSTLRFWEKQFEPLLSPLRSPGGQRRYSGAHVTLVARIKQLQAEGYSLDEMRLMLEQTPTSGSETAAITGIEILADRVAGLVKEEIYRFLCAGPNANAVENRASPAKEIDKNTL